VNKIRRGEDEERRGKEEKETKRRKEDRECQNVLQVYIVVCKN
jgi:hypothetical protein